MTGPTPKQEAALRYIAAFIRHRGWPPTQREIAMALECCETNVRHILNALEHKGLITRVHGAYRCMVVTDDGHKVLTC